MRVKKHTHWFNTRHSFLDLKMFVDRIFIAMVHVFLWVRNVYIPTSSPQCHQAQVGVWKYFFFTVRRRPWYSGRNFRH